MLIRKYPYSVAIAKSITSVGKPQTMDISIFGILSLPGSLLGIVIFALLSLLYLSFVSSFSHLFFHVLFSLLFLLFLLFLI